MAWSALRISLNFASTELSLFSIDERHSSSFVPILVLSFSAVLGCNGTCVVLGGTFEGANDGNVVGIAFWPLFLAGIGAGRVFPTLYIELSGRDPFCTGALGASNDLSNDASNCGLLITGKFKVGSLIRKWHEWAVPYFRHRTHGSEFSYSHLTFAFLQLLHGLVRFLLAI